MKKALDTNISEVQLGACYKRERTKFRVFCQNVDKVSLLLFDREQNECARYKMHHDENGVYSVCVEGDLDGMFYLFCADGKTAVDPYAKACSVNGKMGAIVNFEKTNPDGFLLDKRVCNVPIIYEAHVRDFSIATESEFLGKYLAFSHSLPKKNGVSTLVEHLVELGITYVHLLPIAQNASVDEVTAAPYNWGYDPLNYNIPEGSYCTNPHDPYARIREFKTLVQSLHSAGIGVIMDVVYNHTAHSHDSNFETLARDYYYRKNGKGAFYNGSGCGNEVKSENPFVRKFIADSVEFWAREYHIDGFRFDLMGLHDVDTMNYIRERLDEVDENILIYGEPWFALDTPKSAPMATKQNVGLLRKRVAVFSDTARDNIRGRHFDFVRGYVNGNAAACLSAVRSTIEGGVRGASYSKEFLNTRAESQQVVYISAHDDYTLWDLLCLIEKKTSFDEPYSDILQQNILAAFLLFMSRGLCFIHAGEEFARTKHGNHNSYNSPDSVNKLDYGRKAAFGELTRAYKQFIEFRKQNAAVFKELPEFLDAPDSSLAFILGGRFLCIANPNEKTIELKTRGLRTSAKLFGNARRLEDSIYVAPLDYAVYALTK